MKKERQKGEQKLALSFFFFCVRENGDCSQKFRGHQAMTARSAYQEMLTLRALQSGRTTEYYVLLNLCTIEKRKDLI